MKKKIILGVGIIVLIGSLFINLNLSEQSDLSDISFDNLEALAADEGSGDKKEPSCIESGFVCLGIAADGSSGRHPGLTVNPKQ
mgnify:CR=1 FL=1